MIVLDASAAVELLLGTVRGEAVRRRIGQPDETLHAPHLLDIEVAQVLRRLQRVGVLGVERAAEAIDDLIEYPLRRYPHDVLLPRVWDLRGAVTAYDAVYIALAEVLDAPLLTFDRALATAPGHRARVEVPIR